MTAAHLLLSKLGAPVVPFSALHFGDIEPASATALEARIKALGGASQTYVDSADVVVDDIIAALNPYGLHFAFLDPYNLDQLPFSIIERLARLRRVDMLIHVSLQDLTQSRSARQAGRCT